MSSRNSVVALISLLVLLVFPVVMNAEEVTHISMGEADGVSIHKDWEITFNSDVVEESLNRENIVVVQDGVGKVERPDAYVKDGNVVVVPAPEEGYAAGQGYTLYVGKTIEFQSGLHMENRYKKTFTTEREILDPPEQSGDGVISYGTVTAETLNVRKAPSASSEWLGRYVRGEEVEIYNVDGYWAEVRYQGQKAYMHKNYMKLRSATGGVLKDQIVVLDPGHGAHDGGASANGGLEKEINLDVSKRVYDLLKAKGAKPIMTRTSDTFLELSERVDFSWEHYGDIFVSIHTNAYLSSARGTESFCYVGKESNVEEGCLLAEKIHEQIVQTVNMYDRGVTRGDRGQFGDFHVIRNTASPSVLVELGFITNTGDAEKLTSNYYRDLYAKAIVQGIENYYSAEVK